MSDSHTRTIQTPIALSYTFVAGTRKSRFLEAMAHRRILGLRCAECGLVSINSRGTCPVDAVPLDEEVEVGQRGTLLSWCIVNVPFTGQTLPLPYVCAMIVLDGCDTWFLHVVDGVPHDELTIGMRVEAVWVNEADLAPTFESISHFAPVDEPVVPDAYRAYLAKRPVSYA